MLIIALLLQAVLRSFGTHVWRPIDNRLMEESRRTRLVRSPAYDHLVMARMSGNLLRHFVLHHKAKRKGMRERVIKEIAGNGIGGKPGNIP